jgi:uncharacterized membrane protein
MDLAEPDVAITDLLLALECAVFVVLLARRAQHPLRTCFVGIFSCIGLASLLGGIVHGFFPEESSRGHGLLWPTTLVALVAMASFVWLAGAHLLVAPAHRQWARWFALAAFLAASSFVVFAEASFRVVVVTYFPSILWIAAGYVVVMRRHRSAGVLLIGLVGLLLTLVAAAIQQAGISLHPEYFNHNALYHVVQALALLMVFASTRELAAPAGRAGGPCGS